MFQYPNPNAVIIKIIKELELSLKENKQTAHLSKENVEDFQRTVSYLAKEIIENYENEKRVSEVKKNG